MLIVSRHSFGPYIEGISPETYSEADLDEFADKKVTFTNLKGDKVEVSYYEATQLQRGLEREVRGWKKRQAIREAAGLDASAEKIKVRYWQKRVRAFTEETGLNRQYIRERIAQS